MSADAQPRKRKDKRKKKDEREGFNEKGPPLTPPPTMTGGNIPSSSPDEVMHVYKEGKIGGNPCTKILFFVIMSALAGTISLIIIQHRGISTDSLTKQDAESPITSDSGWSLDFGLGEWISPFSFGSEGGDHGEVADEHDEHKEEGHDEGTEEHGEHEHEEHEHAEEQEGGGLMSWFGWGSDGGGEHTVEHDQEVEHDTEHEQESEATESGGFGSWFGWGGDETPAEDTAHSGEVEDKGSSWFGWGGGDETPAPESAEETGDKDDTDGKDDDDHEDADDDSHEDADDDQDKEADDDQDKEADKEDDEEPVNRQKYSQLHKSLYEDDIDDDVPESREEDDKDEMKKEDQSEEENDTDEKLIDSQEDQMDEDEELRHFLRSLDLEPYDEIKVSRKIKSDHIPFGNDEEDDDQEEVTKKENDTEQDDGSDEQPDDEEEPDDDLGNVEWSRQEKSDIPDRYASTLDDEDDDDLVDLRTSDKPNRKENEQVWNKKASNQVEDDEGEELFPEAAEALRLEKEEESREKEQPQEDEAEPVDEPLDDEPPFSKDELDEDEAQGANERQAQERFADSPAPILVHQTVAPERTVEKRTVEPAREKPFESRTVPSAASKASEFLAERAAERAREEATKQAPPPAPAKQPVFATKQPPIAFPPPPSLTPEASDEEELSDPEQAQYSEGEVDEEELVEEEERLEEEDEEEVELEAGELGESPVPSDDGGELNLEESEPEVEEEEVEEEESEDEPPVVVKKPAVSERDDTRRPTQPLRDTQRRGGPQAYEYEDITDDYDWAIKEELDLADEEFNRHPSGCLHVYQTLQAKYDRSPRIQVSMAKCLDSLAKEANSNSLLEFAIYAYRRALKLPMKDKLFLDAAETLVKRLRFRGFLDQTIEVHRLIVNRFGDNPSYRNDMAISYLMLNKLNEAEKVFNETLSLWPNNAVARSHYGLTLKLQGKNAESLEHLKTGLELDEQATKDARLYFHLGDAYVRTGSPQEALKIYEKGVTLGLFRSMYQRSLYNIDRLEAKPWWTFEETTYTSFFKKLESNWKVIREEGLKAIDYKKGFLNEAESITDTGDWKQFELFAKGVRNNANCQLAKVTCSLIGEFEAARGCRRGQSKFSLMEGGTHVWPHCGPTNCRLRAHLGLVVPPGPTIRVTNITRQWEEGKVFIFDDSFEHEVWHNGKLPRLVLIVDVWHPQITLSERKSLSPI